MKESKSNLVDRLSRREFNRVLAASTLALATGIQGGSQETTPKQPENAVDESLNFIRHFRGLTIAPEMEQKIKTALQYNEAVAKKVREFPLPEGSEPSFVFQPARKGGK